MPPPKSVTQGFDNPSCKNDTETSLGVTPPPHQGGLSGLPRGELKQPQKSKRAPHGARF